MERLATLTSEASFIHPNQRYSRRDYIAAAFLIFLLALFHAAVAFGVVNANLEVNDVRLDTYVYKAAVLYAITFVGFLLLYPVFVMIFVRPKRLTSYLINGLRWYLFSKERWLFSYPVLIIIPLEFSIYTSFKMEIPNLISFWLDEPLFRLDRVIFLGNDPWWVFQQIIGNPNITRAIDFLCHPVWMAILLFSLLFHALGRHSLETRLRFFLSYIAVWALVGNALATLLSSAGPCYFTQVTGDESPYAGLMAYLYSIKTNGLVLNAV